MCASHPTLPTAPAGTWAVRGGSRRLEAARWSSGRRPMTGGLGDSRRAGAARAAPEDPPRSPPPHSGNRARWRRMGSFGAGPLAPSARESERRQPSGMPMPRRGPGGHGPRRIPKTDWWWRRRGSKTVGLCDAKELPRYMDLELRKRSHPLPAQIENPFSAPWRLEINSKRFPIWVSRCSFSIEGSSFHSAFLTGGGIVSSRAAASSPRYGRTATAISSGTNSYGRIPSAC